MKKQRKAAVHRALQRARKDWKVHQRRVWSVVFLRSNGIFGPSYTLENPPPAFRSRMPFYWKCFGEAEIRYWDKPSSGSAAPRSGFRWVPGPPLSQGYLSAPELIEAVPEAAGFFQACGEGP